MKLNIKNYFKSLITKIKNTFSKNSTLSLATENTNLDEINNSKKEKINFFNTLIRLFI